MDIFGRIIRQVVENKNTITVNLQFMSQAHLDMFKRTPSLRRLLHQSQLEGLRYPGANRLMVNHYIFSQLQNIADSTGFTLTRVQSLNEFTEKVINQLVVKFNKEGGPDENVIRAYVQRFKQIQNKLEKKDPFKYTWKEFETVVDANPEKRIKAGKLDPTVSDANLIYNKDGIRVYAGTDKNSCIKYGNGYSWCISARGERNLYANYRLDSHILATPYFVFNDNLSSELIDGQFVDKSHALVIFVRNDTSGYYKSAPYTVTDAENRGDRRFSNFQDVQKVYPWLNDQVGRLIKPVPPLDREVQEYKILQNFNVEMQSQGAEFANDPSTLPELFKFINTDDLCRSFLHDIKVSVLEGKKIDDLIKAVHRQKFTLAKITHLVIQDIGEELEDVTIEYNLSGDFSKQIKDIHARIEQDEDYRYIYTGDISSDELDVDFDASDYYVPTGIDVELQSVDILPIYSSPMAVQDLLKYLLALKTVQDKKNSELSKLRLGVKD